MKNKIAVIPFATYGRNSQVGKDGHINILKKKRSTVIKENLESCFKSENIDAEVIVDVNHGDLQYLIKEGVNLFLIPEEIENFIDYTNVDKTMCIKLTSDEYDNGNIERVIKIIKERL